MPTLTYPDLGPGAQDLVGRLPLGVDAAGWPWQVQTVEHIYDVDGRPVTLVTVEPWPLPAPGESASEEYKQARLRLSRAERPVV